ncbi:hypothetical protein FRC12_000674 [Ceratobasidium sp. 428]|nr:hypothetical protein FRC12_000674 [Ceratobasidium sp. 428]
MDPAPAAAEGSTASAPTSPPPPPPPPLPMVRSYVLSTAAGSCLVALLAVALTMVWRRKQRWRRARPWLAKLRAETASKIEKQKERVEHAAVQPALKDTPSAKGKEKLAVLLALEGLDSRMSDAGSASGKRSKERRKRGKEPKPAVRSAPAQTSRNPVSEPPTACLTPKPNPSPSEQDLTKQPASVLPSPPLSPRLVPLPLSPLLAPIKIDLPALVLSGPASPISTSVSISAAMTELTVTTPTTSTSVSPAPASPAFNSSETTLPTVTRTKLPAFPPASPLPPNLARKAPPLARRATPSTPGSASTPTSMPNISRKDSHAADRRREPNESDGPVEEIEFPTLSPWPVVGKQLEPGKRREREGRKGSDVGRDGRKASDAGRGRKASDAKKKGGARTGGAGAVTNPESTQIASLRGALEAARLREEEVAEERRAWAKKERELQTQVQQLAHQLQLAMMFAAGGGMHAYSGFAYGYGSVPPTPGQGPSQPPSSEAASSSPEQSSSAPVPGSSESSSVSVPSTPGVPQSYPMYLPFPPPFPMFAPQPPHGSPMPSAGMPPHHGPSMPPMSMPSHGSSMTMPPPHSPLPNSQPQPPTMMSPPHGPLSPPQPHALSHPWRGGSPMIGSSGVMTPGMNSGPVGGMNPGPGGPNMNPGLAGGVNPGGMNMMHPVPGRRSTGYFATTSSPRRGGSGSRSRSPFVHAWGDYSYGRVTPSSTPSVGSSVDDGLFGSSVVHPPPATLGSLKREREDDEEEERASESEESDEEDEEDSDDDSVIFEDGSVSDSVNLSLYGESQSKERDLASLPVDIRIGVDAC